MTRGESDSGRWMVTIISLVVIVLGMMLGSYVIINAQADKIEQDLGKLGAIVYSNVEIESPSVIFVVDDYIMFTLLYAEFGPTVYRVRTTFYLFTEDYQIAYKFALIPLDAFTGVKGLGE